MEPALLPETTRGSRLNSSRALTTPKCLEWQPREGREGEVRGARAEPHQKSEGTAVLIKCTTAQSRGAQPGTRYSPEAQAASSREHQAGAAISMAQLPQKGQPVIKGQLCREVQGEGPSGAFVARLQAAHGEDGRPRTCALPRRVDCLISAAATSIQQSSPAAG